MSKSKVRKELLKTIESHIRDLDYRTALSYMRSFLVGYAL